MKNYRLKFVTVFLILFLLVLTVSAAENIIQTYNGEDVGQVGNIISPDFKPEDVTVQGATVMKPAGSETTDIHITELLH